VVVCNPWGKRHSPILFGLKLLKPCLFLLHKILEASLKLTWLTLLRFGLGGGSIGVLLVIVLFLFLDLSLDCLVESFAIWGPLSRRGCGRGLP
jgi:hypothetical protein